MRRNDDFYPPQGGGGTDLPSRIDEFRIPEEAVTQHVGALIPLLEDSFLPKVTPEVTTGPLTLPHQTAPTAPATDKLALYARNRAGRMLPEMLGPVGADLPLQPALFAGSTTMWLPGTGTTAAINWGVNWTVAATQAHPAITTTNYLSQMRRATFTTTAVGGNAAGVRAAAPVCWRGNAAGLGGFFFFARVAVETFEAAMQIAVGLSAASGLLAGEPSAVNDSIWLGKDTGDANWQLITRDNTGSTKVDLGLAVAAGQVLEVMFYCPPNASSITARVARIDSAAVLLDNSVRTATLPRNTQLLRPHAEVRTIAAAAVAIALNRIYIETET